MALKAGGERNTHLSAGYLGGKKVDISHSPSNSKPMSVDEGKSKGQQASCINIISTYGLKSIRMNTSEVLLIGKLRNHSRLFVYNFLFIHKKKPPLLYEKRRLIFFRSVKLNVLRWPRFYASARKALLSVPTGTALL